MFLLGRHHSPSNSESNRPLVVLDAGHGGQDPGAVCEGIEEADVNLAILRRVADLAESDSRLRVRTTRSADMYVTLEDRIALANDEGATLYLSIQTNACGYPEVTGIETLISSTITLGQPSAQFAEILQSTVISTTGAHDRGIRTQELYLHRATMVAALIEVGFLTNDTERAKLLDPSYQDTIAQGIYQGIVAYLDHAVPAFPSTASASAR